MQGYRKNNEQNGISINMNILAIGGHFDDVEIARACLEKVNVQEVVA